MVDKTFVENRHLEARVFELRGSEVHIRFKKRHSQAPAIVSLENVCEGPKRVHARINPAPLKRTGLYLGCLVVVGLVVTRANLIPAIWSAVIFGIFAIPGVHVMLYFCIPFSTEQYRTKSGTLAFDIIRDDSRAGELEDFTKAIDSAIKRLCERSAP